ncbi:MAG: inovirus-type Gp2 protein [Chlorobium sp.]|nr:inovirus-type Gp2 protein [Chlorobium sp.]
MRMVFTGSTYNGMHLNHTWKNHKGYYKEILVWIKLLMEDMVNRHKIVYFVRFDLHYPADSTLRYPDNNDLVSRFSETLMLYCKRHGYDPKYLWAREVSSTGLIHYHFILLLDGRLINNANTLIVRYATELWRKYLNIEDGGGLVHLCKSKENDWRYDDQYGGVIINKKDRNFQPIYEKCHQVASYLAKRYSKGSSPAYVNEFGHSKLS